jgi:Ca2+-binding RTX toxin-like protein
MATVYGDLFGNTLDANDGVTNDDDTIYGYGGPDDIYGLGGDDTIFAGDGDDHVYGGSGNDILWSGWSAPVDWLDGGTGTDTAMYLDSPAGVTVDLGLGEGHSGTADNDELTSIENVTGSLYGDVLVGAGDDNVLSGDFGDDGLIGQGGDDTLIGGLGADELIGVSGIDTASYIGAMSGIAASLASGEGSLGEAAGDTFESVENLTGSLFADTLTGDASANVLDGYGGNDELKGGGGADTLIGGTGTDTALYTDSDTGVTVNLVSGLGFDGTAEGDTLDDIENVDGSIYADTLTGDANANRLFGSNGDDTLKGGGGADTLQGGSGIDTVQYSDSGSGVTVELLVGTGSGGTAEGDTFSSIENVLGSVYDDTLSGDDDANVLYGNSGNDWLKGGGGADTLDGGPGNDTATYLNHGGGVTVSLASGGGTAGDALGDVLTDIENLYGTDYADTLLGDTSVNILHGGNGDDVLKGGGGADRLIGGEGVDTVTYLGSTAVAVNLASGTGFGGWAQGNTLTGIENVIGSSSGDILAGDTQANTLRGDGGNDVLAGGGGADTLHGDAGTDTATYIESVVGVNVNLLAGTGTGGTAAGDTLTDVENLTGSLFDDVLTGDDESNVLQGNLGADALAGNGGDDIYLVDNAGDTITENGGRGIDTVLANGSYVLTAGADVELLAAANPNGNAAIDLTGNAAGNVVRGNAGNNVINGGDGRDTLTGLGGADSFLFDTPLDAAVNLDVITDFSVADDTIALENTVFAALAAGPLAAERFVVGAAAQDASDNIIYNDVTGALLYDSDGVGAAAAIQFATVTPGLALTNLDFIVV